MDLGDAALVGDVAITTDAFVVKPLRFPGGSIGELAVNGTVNDLAMAGARPEALTLSLILEEGLESDVLRAEVDAIARAAEAAGVRIVGGDTKVVERGHADGMYITTTGLGTRRPARRLRDAAARRPDPALRRRSPPTARRSCSRAASSTSKPTSSPTRGPCGPTSTPCSGRASATLRDATRGGVASVLNELARAAGVAMLIQEAAVPVAPAVAGACELLGIDPMHVANEGVFVAIVAPDIAVARLRRHRRDQDRPARHGAGRDELRRQAGDGRTGRRPAAEDLLMHELSIADAIVRIACAHSGRGGGSRRSKSRSGTCARSCPTRSRSRSPSSPRGRDAEGAELVMEVVPAAGICRACGIESEWSGFPLACAACGGLDVELVRGEELLVDALTMEGVPSGRS